MDIDNTYLLIITEKNSILLLSCLDIRKDSVIYFTATNQTQAEKLKPLTKLSISSTSACRQR